jgi:solute carrier family 35 (UDP-sugar transporter), member A1/2/3
LGNLKIVSTGFLLWLVLKRAMSPLQWMALMLLMVGATTSQINTDCSSSGGSFSAPLQGYVFGLLSATLSAVAAVYTEWVMKKNSDSLYWQNMQLYFFGMVFNGMALMWTGGVATLLNPLEFLQGKGCCCPFSCI